MALFFLMLVACSDEGPVLDQRDGGPGTPICRAAGETACDDDVAIVCEADGPGIREARTDCSLTGGRCRDGACVPCLAGSTGCFEGNAASCRADESGWDPTEVCDLAAGDACHDGTCVSLCELAQNERSYAGCEFYPVDLDTQGHGEATFGIIVSNPNPFTTHVVLEVDESAPGEPRDIRAIEEVEIPALDLETFVLGRRRVDGHLDGATFVETHSAQSRRAYRVRARHPVIAYQFNPLQQADVFSNDASLLFPTSALGTETTVIGWPQTISTRGTAEQRGEGDYRSTLTLVGTADATRVSVTFGPAATRVVGIGDAVSYGPGETATFEVGPFDVVNLETDGFLADFTGSRVESSHGVVVYTGSEGADVPSYDRVVERLCCADHIEGQLAPDRSLGTHFVIARTPSRSRAINDALTDPLLLLPVANEPEYARVLAVEDGVTRIDTNLAPPFDAFVLERGESAMLLLDRDTEITASRPIAAIQLLAGQYATGIPFEYPGGDPALVVVAPTDQFRKDYVFLTPATYGFDAVTIVSAPGTTIELDGAPPSPLCETATLESNGAPAWIVHRCPLSFPEVRGDFSVVSGEQGDGVHRVTASAPVGVVVSGFDAFVSYAYAAGMDLEVLR
jgi:hypothetical protein